MVNHGSKQHQELIRDTVLELENLGYNVVNTNGRCPDAIATIEGKIFAVEVLLVNQIPKTGWEHLSVVKKKRDLYNMYDDIIFKVSDRDIKILTGQEKEQIKMEKKAQNIVNDYIKELQYEKKLRGMVGDDEIK